MAGRFDGIRVFAALLKREMIVTLRAWWAFGLLTLTTGAGIAAVGIMAVGAQGIQDYAQISQMLFGQYTVLVFLSAILMVPPVAAFSLSSERELGTFEQVLLTPVTYRQILWAKILGAFFFYLLLFTSTLPTAGILFFLVGVDGQQFAIVTATSVLTALTLSIIGVACSARSSGALQAAFKSLFYMLVLLGPPQIIIGGIVTVGIAGVVLGILYGFISPVAIIVRAVVGGAGEAWVPFVCGAVYQFLAMVTAYEYAVQPFQTGFPAPPPLPRKPGFNVSRPILFPDSLRRMFVLAPHQELLMLQAALLAIVPFLAFAAQGLMDFDRPSPGLWGFWPALILAGTVPVSVAVCFSRQHESGAMDLLRTTLLTPGWYLRAQWAIALAAHAPLLAGVLFLGLVQAAFAGSPEASIAAELAILGVFLCFVLLLALSQLASLLFRRSFAVLVLSYAFSLALVAGPPALRPVFFDFPVIQYCLRSPMELFLLYEPSSRNLAAQNTDWLTDWLYMAGGFSLLAGIALAASHYVLCRYHLRDR